MKKNTSEQGPLAAPFLNRPSFYQIPKWLVWSIMIILFLSFFYKLNDSWRHQNWPPVDPRNAELIKSLNLVCDKKSGSFITKAMLGDDPNDKTFSPVGFDRMAFIESPACIGVRLYLSYEGTGIREEWNVYDMTNKRKTASIVITHDRFDHK